MQPQSKMAVRRSKGKLLNNSDQVGVSARSHGVLTSNDEAAMMKVALWALTAISLSIKMY